MPSDAAAPVPPPAPSRGPSGDPSGDPSGGGSRPIARLFLRQTDACFLGFAALLLPAWIYVFATTGSGGSYVVRNAGVLLLFAALRWGPRETAPLRTATWLRIGIACVVLPFDYFQTGPLIEFTRGGIWERNEAFLMAWDLRLFGEGYHAWIRDVRVPWITEILQVCYAAFYILPLGLMALLILRRKAWALPRALFGVVSCFLVSYLGYLVVPGRSPAFLPGYEHLVHDGGVWIATDVWNHVREAGRGAFDVFPSGHTAVCLLVVYYAARFDRVTFRILTPIAACVILSTVYFQYHYVLDLPAGLLLTLLVILWDRIIRWRADAEPGLQESWSSNGR